MNIFEATERMRAIVSESASAFSELPLYLHTEEFFSDSRLGPTTEEKAKYISVTLVIRTKSEDDEDGGAEHRIGIGVEVKKHAVTEEELEAAAAEFKRTVNEAFKRLKAAEVCEDEVIALEREADEKYREMIEEYKKSLPRKMFALIGAVIIAVGLIVLATVL